MPQVDTKPMTDRVVVNRHGLAVRAETAFFVHNICARIIFVRDDGWSLGAPAELADVAYRTWPSHWAEFRVWPDYEARPISEYRPGKRQR